LASFNLQLMARDMIDMEEDMQIDDTEIFGLADSNQSETEDAERPPPLHPNFEREFLGHTDSIFTLDVGCEGDLVISGGADEVAQVWRLEDLMLVATLKGHTDSIIWAGFSKKAKYCATASMDATVRVYNVEDFSLRHVLDGPTEEIESASWHSRGPAIIAASRDCTVWMWDAKKGYCLQVFAGHAGPASCALFSANGAVAISAAEDGQVKLWDPKNGTNTRTFSVTKHEHFHEDMITSMAVHPSEKIFATGSGDTSIFLMNWKKGKILTTLRRHEQSVEALAFSPSISYLASGGLEGLVVVWDLRTHTRRWEARLESGVLSLVWSKEPSNYLFAGTVDGTIHRYDGRTGSLLCEYRGHTQAVTNLVLRNNFLISSSDDGKCIIWDQNIVEDFEVDVEEENVDGASDQLNVLQPENLEQDAILPENTSATKI